MSLIEKTFVFKFLPPMEHLWIFGCPKKRSNRTIRTGLGWIIFLLFLIVIPYGKREANTTEFKSYVVSCSQLKVILLLPEEYQMG